MVNGVIIYCYKTP